ncbi:MAG: hypothetical protein HZA34_03335 [Candidatus Pacebacteria bacterium]|nr:hypothetical protein [Candidatus Paceibacterota bacterium]
MKTLNISLPEKLQEEASLLVKRGHYVSFSDLVRTAIRSLLERSVYDSWYEETKGDVKKGKAIILENKKQLRRYMAGL